MDNAMYMQQKRRYLNAKIATEKYRLNLEFLSLEQRKDVDVATNQLLMLQQKILASNEAQQVQVDALEVSKAFQQCVENFDTTEAFITALSSQAITEEGYKRALKEQLHCEKVLGLVAANIPALSREHALEYYQKHRLNFSRSTTWKLNQILITINDEFEDNIRINAEKRIKSVFLLSQTTPFSELALKYSECPSAVESGHLGWCEEEKLFPQITDALYSLKAGQISHPIETEAGFHLVKWEQKKAPYVASFDEVYPYLEEKHQDRATAYIQRQWLSQLAS
ncbi:peptidylprolyl isomerase [Vibrio ulleungensis]|uniref:peptidylprolyl isomerase n=1 Tax=Vibrio ulleungensis TaxID=2807619 RepID=A0ABS2HDC7_9VIBR|nr:peptidylprolyl isomerase [Vibrio ulleungensis]MBM7035595.1 peptidylprolyl isomerase [Vibrio ulleungensis]